MKPIAGVAEERIKCNCSPRPAAAEMTPTSAGQEGPADQIVGKRYRAGSGDGATGALEWTGVIPPDSQSIADSVHQ